MYEGVIGTQRKNFGGDVVLGHSSSGCNLTSGDLSSIPAEDMPHSKNQRLMNPCTFLSSVDVVDVS